MATVSPAIDLLDAHREYQNTKRADLRECLVRHYEGLAVRLADRASRQRQERDDLCQVARIGLLKALDRYDVARGTAFTTFAWATITGELKRYRRDADWGVHVPRRLQEAYLRTSAGLEECTNRLGRSPTTAELAAVTGDAEDDVIEALAVRDAHHPMSLDAPIGSGDGDSYAVELGERVSEFEDAEGRDWLVRAVSMLPEREREIVRLRFVEELTQSQIAAAVGLSQMQVSRLLARSLALLREWTRAGAQDGQAG